MLALLRFGLRLHEPLSAAISTYATSLHMTREVLQRDICATWEYHGKFQRLHSTIRSKAWKLSMTFERKFQSVVMLSKNGLTS